MSCRFHKYIGVVLIGMMMVGCGTISSPESTPDSEVTVNELVAVTNEAILKSTITPLATGTPIPTETASPTDTALPSATSVVFEYKPTSTIAATNTPLTNVVAPTAESVSKCPNGCTSELPGCDIKGNINSKGEKNYHTKGDSSYTRTKIDPSDGERWFCSIEEAVANGWRAPNN